MMKRFLFLILSAVFIFPAFAGKEAVMVDTQTHALQNSVIDATNVTLTVGGFTISDASGVKIIHLGTVSGTKIGGAGEKIGFLDAVPIVRPSATTDLRLALINLGLYTTGGASPLNLNGGAFTAGLITATTGTFSGNGTIGGTFSVTGASTLHAISGTNETLSGTLGVTGNSTFGGTVGITGATTASSLTLSGNETVGGTLGITGTTSGTAFSFSGNGTVGGTFGVTGATTLAVLNATTGTFSGAVSAPSYGAVNATTGTFSSSISATNATLSGTLTTGPLTGTTAAFSGNETIGGTLGITGALSGSSAAFTGNETVGGTFGVTGNTSLSSLTVSGNVGFYGGTAIARPSGSILTAVANLNLVSAPTLNFNELTGPPVVSASNYAGANAGAQIAAAIAALPSSGGTVDARGLTGAQSITSDPIGSSTKPLTILLGQATYTINGSNDWITLHSNQRIIGSGIGQTILKVATNGVFQDAVIATVAGATDVEIAGLTIDGSNGITHFNMGIYLNSALRPSLHDLRVTALFSTLGNIYVAATADNSAGKFNRIWIDGDPTAIGGKCHGLTIRNVVPRNDYHQLSDIWIQNGSMAFHFVQSNHNQVSNCGATATALNSSEGFNLDSSNDNTFTNITASGRGDAGFIETNNESFAGSPACARNQIFGGVFTGNGNDGLSVNGIDELYVGIVTANNGQIPGNPNHGVYMAGTRARLIGINSFDNQGTHTQDTGIYLTATAVDTRIMDATFSGAMTNLIFDSGTNTRSTYFNGTTYTVSGALSVNGSTTITGNVLVNAGTLEVGNLATFDNGVNSFGPFDVHSTSNYIGFQSNTPSALPPSYNGTRGVFMLGGNYSNGSVEVNLFNSYDAGGNGFRFSQKTGASAFHDLMWIDGNTTSGNTPLLLYDSAAGTLKRVSIGAADSGGTGYKVLRVPN